MKKLHVTALGLAAGITWGAAIFLIALFTMKWGWGGDFLNLIASVYIGVEASFQGAVVGLIWGFVDAFIGAAIFAWLYNHFAKKLK